MVVGVCPQGPVATPFASPAAAQTSPVTLPPGPVRLQRTEDGLVAEPVTLTRSRPLPIDVPAVFVSKLALSGEVDGGIAELDAEIVVNLTDGEEWQLVRLGLPEANVLSSSHRSEIANASAAPVVSGTRSDELTWKLRGTGAHTIRLRLHAPVVAAVGGGQQLSLTLPPLQPGYRATLELRVPIADADVRAGEATAVRVRPWMARPRETDDEPSREAVAAGTVIAADLPGSRLNLSWSAPARSDVRQITEVRTAITVQPDAEQLRLSLDARQTLTATSPDLFESFDVLLPEDFELLDVTDATGRLNVSVTPDPQSPRRVTVAVIEPRSESITLDWRLRRSLQDAAATRVVLGGFRVPDAKSQTGTATLVATANYRLLPEKDQFRGVQLESFVEGRAELRIDAQPFAAPVSVVANRPFFLAGPKIALRFSRDRVELTADVTIDVLSGRLSQVPILWTTPSMAWQPLRLRPRGDGASDTTIAADSSTPRVEGRLVRRDDRLAFEPLDTQTGAFRFVLTTSRPLVASGAPIDIPLPLVESRQARRPEITVLTDPSIEIELEGVGESRLELLPTLPKPTAVEDIDRDANRFTRRYVSLTESPEIEATITRHEKSVSAVSRFAVGRADEEFGDRPSLVVAQSLDLDVRYARLDEIRLSIPESLVAQAGVLAIRNIPIGLDETPIARDAISIDDGRLLRVSLPRPVSEATLAIGPFTVAAETATVAVPVFRPIETTIRESQLTLLEPSVNGLSIAAASTASERSNPTREEVAVATPEDRLNDAAGESRPAVWTRLPIAGSTTYVASVPDAAPTITLGEVDRAAGRHAVVEAALIQTRLTPGGQLTTDARYRLPDTFRTLMPGRLLVQLPPGVEGAAAFWDEIETESELRMADGGVRLIVTPPPSTGQALLRVSYRQQEPIEGGLVRLRWEPPELGPNVHVERTDWEVAIPDGLHLMQSPAALSREFDWTRNGFGWSRQAVPDYLTRRDAVWDGVPMPSPPWYAYSTPGSLPAIDISFVARSWLVLVGAAITLAFSFVLLKFPARRQLPLVLLAGFAVALAAVQYLEPLQLLLQPALLGLLLAAAAVTIDGWNRQPASGPVLTVPSESAFVQPDALKDMLDDAATQVVSPRRDLPRDRGVTASPTDADDPVSPESTGSSLAQTIVREPGTRPRVDPLSKSPS